MRSCEDVQAMISAMLDGELPEAACAEVQAHIAECDDCRGMYQAFAAVRTAVTAEEPLPERLHENIMSTVRMAEQAMRKQKKLMRLRTVLSLAACLVVVVGTVFSLRSTLLRPKNAPTVNGSAFAARTYMNEGDAVEMEADEARSGDTAAAMPEGDLSPAMAAQKTGDAGPADAPMEAPEPKPELDDAMANGAEMQMLTLQLTAWTDDSLVGTVTACSGDVFAEGQEITVLLEQAEVSLDSAAAAGTAVEVTYDHWEGDIVYAGSVRPAE